MYYWSTATKSLCSQYFDKIALLDPEAGWFHMFFSLAKNDNQAEWYGRDTRKTGCHPEGPGQTGEVGLCEPHEVQHGQVQGPTPGLG